MLNREVMDLFKLTSDREAYTKKVEYLNLEKKELLKKNKNDNSKVFSDLKNDIKEIDESLFKQMKILEFLIYQLKIKNYYLMTILKKRKN